MKTVSVNAVGGEGFRVDVAARDFNMIVDQPPAMGGVNSGPNPLEYALASLASCMVTVGKIIAKQERFELRGMSAKIDGDVEVDVLMGKNKELRAGFLDVRMELVIDADMTAEEKYAFVEKIEARCPISDMIANATPVSFVIK
ncbi:MAG: OsmC family protein [Anaerolineaceae bacterium]|nr:OsmC family protein [Anaerolineaceae bacterium]